MGTGAIGTVSLNTVNRIGVCLQAYIESSYRSTVVPALCQHYVSMELQESARLGYVPPETALQGGSACTHMC